MDQGAVEFWNLKRYDAPVVFGALLIVIWDSGVRTLEEVGRVRSY
jgi:hypothetical protein